MKKCNHANCTACPYILEGKEVIINKDKLKINKHIDCNTFNIVSAIMCRKKLQTGLYRGN